MTDSQLKIYEYDAEEKDKLELHAEHIMGCMKCGEKLATVIKTNELGEDHKFQAFCSCGGKSFIKKDSGKFFMGPAEGKVATNVVTEVTDEGFTNQIYIQV